MVVLRGDSRLNIESNENEKKVVAWYIPHPLIKNKGLCPRAATADDWSISRLSQTSINDGFYSRQHGECPNIEGNTVVYFVAPLSKEGGFLSRIARPRCFFLQQSIKLWVFEFSVNRLWFSKSAVAATTGVLTPCWVIKGDDVTGFN